MKKSLEEQIKDIKDKAEADIQLATKREEQRAKVHAANAEARKATEELRTRLESENGMEKHPKRDILWSKAWEHGHSSGLGEVENWYNDLIDLVKE